MPHEDFFERYLLEHNLLGISSLKTLYQAEKEITLQKSLMLEKEPIGAGFSYEHLKKIHHFLFEDIYDFAGRDRCELGIEFLGKGKSRFILGSEIPKWSEIIFNELEQKCFFTNYSESMLLEGVVMLFADINALHPFREGNGRVQRIFIKQLVQTLGYDLDFSKVSQLENEYASKEAMFNRLDKMHAMFQKILIKQ